MFLTAYVGDLGLGDGIPESVCSLDKTQMTQVRKANGQPFAQALRVGETMRLPGGQGSITFDGVSRFANLQIAHDPGKEISLVAALLLLVCLTAAPSIRRRRVWVRIHPEPGVRTGTTVIETAGQSLSRRPAPAHDVEALIAELGLPQPDIDTRDEETR